MLQYAQQLCHKNDLDARAASKHSFDVRAKFRSFKIGDEVLLHIPSPPPGHNSKFYTPWRGIYKVTQKTSEGTYLVKKDGKGKARRAHVNRLKFYDPKNSHEDPAVHISCDDDEEDVEEQDDKSVEEPTTKSPFTLNPNQRITRSKTKNLPPPITRYQHL
jgi:hypothetical protein